MTSKEKQNHLKGYSEDKLRKELLFPLLTRLGFYDPILHHHAGEKGKDIICKEFDEKFGKIRYLAVIVKRGNVTGSASGSNSYFAVINQIKQAIHEPYRHVYELREIQIDQVILIISGHFLPTALDSIFSTLKAERIDKAIRETIDIGRLVPLVDTHFPEFWEEIEDQNASLIKQRNILLNNLAKLLKVFIPNSSDRERAIDKLAAEELDVDILPFREFARYIIDIGYRNILIEEIDSSFVSPFVNTDHNDIKQSVFDIKKKAQSVLMEIDEEIEPLRRILKETNPREMVGLCREVGRNATSDGRMTFDVSDIISGHDLENAVSQYEIRREWLDGTQTSDLYTRLMEDMHRQMEAALEAFWSTHPKDECDWWLGYAVSFSLEKSLILASKAYEFQAEPRVLNIGHISEEIETSRAYLDHQGELHVECVVNRYGTIFYEKYSKEQKVIDFLWWFERELAERFFELLASMESQ